MRKWNIAGLVVFALVMTLLLLFGGDGEIRFFLFLLALTCGSLGIFITAMDRWLNEVKRLSLLPSCAWSGYWGLVAYEFFWITALYGFAVGFGHGDVEARTATKVLMYGCLGATAFFSGLAIANIIRFFVRLFSLPKLTN